MQVQEDFSTSIFHPLVAPTIVTVFDPCFPLRGLDAWVASTITMLAVFPHVLFPFEYTMVGLVKST